MSSLRNPFKELQELFAGGAVLVGTVTAYASGVATLTMHGGGQMRARGEATVGMQVYVRDGVIQGPAPELPVDSASL